MASDSADPIRVLVIDDDPGHAATVAEGLERVGYECTVATSGTAGAKRLDADEFDVVLTDLRMAGVDGLGIVKKAKQVQPESEVVDVDTDTRRAIVAEVLQQLPDHRRLPLVRYHFEEMSYDEIARQLGVSLAKVKIDILRARATLAKALAARGLTADCF